MDADANHVKRRVRRYTLCAVLWGLLALLLLLAGVFLVISVSSPAYWEYEELFLKPWMGVPLILGFFGASAGMGRCLVLANRLERRAANPSETR
jgi:hypothetical protein